MTSARTRYEALIACRDAAGSDSQMARDLGVSQPRVWRWINQSRQLPAEYVLEAERIYDVSRHELRPDIYPREAMVDQAAGLRFVGLDRRASSRADRLALGERYAQAG